MMAAARGTNSTMAFTDKTFRASGRKCHCAPAHATHICRKKTRRIIREVIREGLHPRQNPPGHCDCAGRSSGYSRNDAIKGLGHTILIMQSDEYRICDIGTPPHNTAIQLVKAVEVPHHERAQSVTKGHCTCTQAAHSRAERVGLIAWTRALLFIRAQVA